MKKIPSVFKRNYDTDRLFNQTVVEGCEWVLAGEGIATIKFDGTACMVRDGKLFKRYDVRGGKTPPADWEPCEEAPDENTGHWPGWLPVGDGTEDKWAREAAKNSAPLADGTYELMGPKVQRNPNNLPEHRLIRHGSVTTEVNRGFHGLRIFLEENPNIEGLVFHHPDGRMAKVKQRDFGFKWPPLPNNPS